MISKYPIVTLTGPRQSGKSTLLRTSFPDYQYVSLEDLDMRLFATEDPRGFLTNYPDKTIIDEVQRVPELFSYLQTHVDKENKEGMYLLAGSHNFLLMESMFYWCYSNDVNQIILKIASNVVSWNTEFTVRIFCMNLFFDDFLLKLIRLFQMIFA